MVFKIACNFYCLNQSSTFIIIKTHLGDFSNASMINLPVQTVSLLRSEIRKAEIEYTQDKCDVKKLKENIKSLKLQYHRADQMRQPKDREYFKTQLQLMNDLLRMLKELTSQKKTAILDIRRKMLRYTKKRQHSDWKKKNMILSTVTNKKGPFQDRSYI